MKQSIADLLAWKLDQYHLDPLGRTELTSRGGSGNPHPSGTRLTVDVITSHRDVNSTLCPGQKMYDFLPELRRQVADRMK
ncbi:N-acetylmuramoyl-L-alanine amidase [Streptomyces gamaensis]|uniref:N-acetylmuramoyl-L-alanine amidase n=1 Tax=Streptomyces gamaensis TaxID=1763542 RepID=A0ABW0ZAK3_9ACTN